MIGVKCIHGGLLRKCETCDLADRNEELEREVAGYELLIESYKEDAERLKGLEREVAELKLADERAIAGYFRDDGTQGEDLSGIPNGFREHVEKVARGDADIETLLPNWDYIRKVT